MAVGVGWLVQLAHVVLRCRAAQRRVKGLCCMYPGWGATKGRGFGTERRTPPPPCKGGGDAVAGICKKCGKMRKQCG